MKFSSKTALTSVPFNETPLPGPAITLPVMDASPLMTLIPTASTPKFSQIVSSPTSEEVKVIRFLLIAIEEPL